MYQDQLFKVFQTLMIYHVAVNPHNPFEVRCGFDERIQVEVWRDRLESGARPRRRHLEM
jgi:hypothetical protein